MTKKFKAEMALIAVTFGWGTSYILMDICLEEMGPFNLNAIRFLSAFILSFAVLHKRMKGISLDTIKYGAILGASLVLVYTGATFSTIYGNLAVIGFLNNLNIILTPIMAFIFKHYLPEKKFYLVLAMCISGMFLLLMQSSAGFTFGKGECFCMMCAISYSVEILVTETAVSRDTVDPLQLAVVQFGFTGLFMLILTLLFETPALPESPEAWGAAAFLTIVCTGIAFLVQNVAQKYTTASHTSLIFAMEPVFSCIAAYVFAGEALSMRGYIGGALMVLSLFVLEIDFSKLKKS